jgi:hypothetical protein
MESRSKLALGAGACFFISCFAQPVGAQDPMPSCMATIGRDVGVTGANFANYVYFNNLGEDGAQVQEKLETLGISWTPNGSLWNTNKIDGLLAQASPADIEEAKKGFCLSQDESARTDIERARALLRRQEGIIQQSSAFEVEQSVDEAIAGFAGVQNNPYVEAALTNEANAGFKQALTLRISVNIVKGRGPDAVTLKYIGELPPSVGRSVLQGADKMAEAIRRANKLTLVQTAKINAIRAKLKVEQSAYRGALAATAVSPGPASQGASASCAELNNQLLELKSTGICSGLYAIKVPECKRIYRQLMENKCLP